jgi:hypothetical protein
MRAMFAGASRGNRGAVVGGLLGLVWVLALLLTLPASPASAQAGADGSSPQLDWTRQIGSAQDDSSYGITADSTGSYVIGTIDGKDFVRKYDVRGNKVWTRHIGSAGSHEAKMITSDSTGVYVAGKMSFPDGDGSKLYNIYLRKYDASGNEMWTRKLYIDGQLDWYSVHALAADPTGVYVAHEEGPARFLSKYDRSGNELWRREVFFGSNVMLSGHSSGVYMAWTEYDQVSIVSEHNDEVRYINIPVVMAVRKYDASGEVVWTRPFRPEDNIYNERGDVVLRGQNWATAIAADRTGVYAVANERYLGKYDHSGNLLWSRQSWEAKAVATNSTGVYVVGSDSGDAFVRRYDTSGNETWTQKLASSQDDSLHAAAATSDGVYVAGDTTGALPGETSAGKRDVIVARYQTRDARDADCNSLWTRQYGASGNDVANATLRVGTNDLYAAGSMEGALPGQTSAGLSDAYVRKYDANGNLVWTRQFGSSADDHAYGLASNPTGLYVVGQVGGALPGQTSLGSDDAFVRKYDFGGNLLWTRQFGGTDPDEARAVTADLSGVYVTGNWGGQAQVKKYDNSGNLQWTRLFGMPPHYHAYGLGIVADSTGVYVSGETDGTLPGQTSAGARDALVRKYDHSGNLQWTRQFGTSGNDRANAIISDSTGVYAVGGTDGTLPGQTSAGNRDAFVRKYASNGTLQWTRQFGTSAGDEALGITADGTGVYATGGTGGTLSHQTSAGSGDAFVRKFGQAGRQEWTRQFGSALDDDARATAVDGTGLYAAGSAQEALPCQVAAGGADAYLTKVPLPGAIAAPYTPDLDPVSDSGASDTDNVTNDSTPTFTGFAESESTAQIRIMVDGQAMGSGTVGAGGAYTVTTSVLADGTHMITAVAVDGSGNASKPSAALSVTVDTKQPVATLDLAAESDTGVSSTDNVTNDTTPTFTGVDPEAMVKIYVDGQEKNSVVADPDGVYSMTTALADATYSVTITVTDTAGNASERSTALAITIDTVAPAVPSTPDLWWESDSGASDTDNVTNDIRPWFVGTAEVGTIVKILVDGVEKGSDVTSSEGKYDVRASSVAHGKRAVTAVAMDPAGNLTQPSVALSVTIDTEAPVAKAPVQVLATSSQLGTTAVPVTLTWSATDQGSRVERYALARSQDHITWTGVSLPSLLATSVSVPLEPGNGYRFRVQARDLAGNWGDWAYEGFDVIPYQEDSTEIVYTGAWTRVADANAYGGYTKTSTQVGAKATFNFEDAENIGVVMPRRSDLGVVRICLDPGTATESCGNVDLSPDTTSLLGSRKLVWVRNNLDLNVPHHTVSITVVSGRVNLDAIVYLGHLGSSL